MEPIDSASLSLALNRVKEEVQPFRKFLKQFSSKQLDPLVAQLYQKTAQEVDCLACGACCRSLEPELGPEDSMRLAKLESMSLDDFLEKRTDLSHRGRRFLKARPCPYLEGNCCTVYSKRPASCQDYPHLDAPHFRFRKQVWEQYRLCPIVFRTVEQLKRALDFPGQSLE